MDVYWVQELDARCKGLIDAGQTEVDEQCGELVKAAAREMRDVDEYTVQLAMVLAMEEDGVAQQPMPTASKAVAVQGKQASRSSSLGQGPIDMEEALRNNMGNSALLLELMQASYVERRGA